MNCYRPCNELAEYLWPRIDIGQWHECWPWMLCVDEDGYGKGTFRGQTIRAHRAALMLVSDNWCDELKVLHHCDYPPCCNPTHLRQDTQQANVDEMVARGRAAWQKSL